MPSDGIEKPNWERFHSRVLIRAPAILERTVEEADKEEYPQQRKRDVTFESEGTLVYEYHLRNCMTNVDAYFDPDYLYDVSQEFWAEDDHVIADFRDVEYEFDVYADELRDGAEVRAWEDSSHEVNVLAGWLYQAVRCGHVTADDQRVFLRAFRRALDDYDDPPDWGLTTYGEPDGRRGVDATITNLEAATSYARNLTYEEALEFQERLEEDDDD
jgi:hypothetical protein